MHVIYVAGEVTLLQTTDD